MRLRVYDKNLADKFARATNMGSLIELGKLGMSVKPKSAEYVEFHLDNNGNPYGVYCLSTDETYRGSFRAAYGNLPESCLDKEIKEIISAIKSGIEGVIESLQPTKEELMKGQSLDISRLGKTNIKPRVMLYEPKGIETSESMLTEYAIRSQQNN